MEVILHYYVKLPCVKRYKNLSAPLTKYSRSAPDLSCDTIYSWFLTKQNLVHIIMNLSNFIFMPITFTNFLKEICHLCFSSLSFYLFSSYLFVFFIFFFCVDNGWNSRSQMFFKIDVLKNFGNFTGKQLCWSLFLIKLQSWRPETLFKRDSNTGVFLWSF